MFGVPTIGLYSGSEQTFHVLENFCPTSKNLWDKSPVEAKRRHSRDNDLQIVERSPHNNFKNKFPCLFMLYLCYCNLREEKMWDKKHHCQEMGQLTVRIQRRLRPRIPSGKIFQIFLKIQKKVGGSIDRATSVSPKR